MVLLSCDSSLVALMPTNLKLPCVVVVVVVVLVLAVSVMVAGVGVGGVTGADPLGAGLSAIFEITLILFSLDSLEKEKREY